MHGSDTACMMQGKMGGDPQAMVSSEMAAMVDLVVLDELLQPYRAEGVPAHLDARYIKLCKEHAAKLGVPWWQVHYCFFLSMDNCRKHPWIRRLLLKPRVSDAVLARLHETVEKQAQQWGVQEAEQQARAHTERLAQEAVADRYRALTHAELDQLAELEQALALYLRSKRVEALEQEHGCTLFQFLWWCMAARWPWLRIVHPEAFMPLAECTPDVHCTIEHMVGTVKGWVAKQIWLRLGELNMWAASTFQQLVREAVQLKGNGAAGLRHIRGSLKKWIKTCRIIAQDEGKMCVFMDVITKRTSNGELCEFVRLELVEGSGGKFVPNAKWS